MSNKMVIAVASLMSLVFFSAFIQAQTTQMDIGSASGNAGNLVQVPIYLESTGNAQPAALQMDVVFNAAVLTFTQSLAGAAASGAGKMVNSNPTSPGNLRLIVAGLNQNVIANGIVALLEFRIATGTPISTTPLSASGVRASNAQAQPINTLSGNGLVIIGSGIANPSELFFPQIADGGGFITTFILVNPTNSPVTGLLELFTTNGSPLAFNLNGNIDSAFPVSLPGKGLLILDSTNTNPTFQAGWGRVRSSSTIGGSIRYSYARGAGIANVISEAGINTALPVSTFSLSVDTRRSFLAGLAVANPNATSISLTITLYNSNGVQVTQRTRTLAALNQFAEMMDQVFPGTDMSNFTGVVTVTAAGGQMIGTTLRFNATFSFFSSLPVI